jgi:predicted acyl esterase
MNAKATDAAGGAESTPSSARSGAWIKSAAHERISRPGAYAGYSEKRYAGYVLTSEYVTVRDGTKLAVDIYRPKHADGSVATEPLPVLLMHTPYNRRYFARGTPIGGLSGEAYPGAAARLIDYGYVVAIADFRGLYASFGQNQGFNRGEWVKAARMDAYDLVEWLARQPWATDKVGMWGASATGGSQMQAATTAPPHLRAVFPMSCELDAYAFAVPGGIAPPHGDTKSPPGATSASARDAAAEAVDGDLDRTQLMAALADHRGSIENPGYVPFRDSVSPHIPEPWWLTSSPHTYLDAINRSGIAFYVAANWNEGATKHGAFFTQRNVTTSAKLLVGPGEHCAWTWVAKKTGFDIAVEELRFFDYWLKGIDNGIAREPKVYYYTYNEPAETSWRSASEWPLPNERRTRFYLGEGRLELHSPANDARDEVVVDYDDTGAGSLSYETLPLPAAVRVTGHPLADLWISSSANDGDFVATLFDVAPDGAALSYHMHGRLRASLRKEQAAPYDNLGLPWHPMRECDVEPLVPGTPTRLRFDLLPMSVSFKRGHRIRLVLSFADAATPRLEPPPTITIHRDPAHASSIVLPIIPDS